MQMGKLALSHLKMHLLFSLVTVPVHRPKTGVFARGKGPMDNNTSSFGNLAIAQTAPVDIPQGIEAMLRQILEQTTPAAKHPSRVATGHRDALLFY